MKNILTTLKIACLTSTLLLFTSYVGKESTEKYNLESGINISSSTNNPFSEKEKQAIDKLARGGYSGININIKYLQKNNTSSEIYPEPEINKKHLEDLVNYSISKGLKIYLRPLINNEDGGSRSKNLPLNIDEWFTQYTSILEDLTKKYSDKNVNLYIGSELDSLLEIHSEKFEELAYDIKESGFTGNLLHSIIFNYDLDSAKINILNKLPIDIIGIDFYVSMENAQLAEQDKFYEAKYYLQNIFKWSKKPVISTELGYRSIPNGNIMPWSHQEKNLPSDYTIQKKSYDNFLKALLSKEFKNKKNLGVCFWISDTNNYTSDILLSKSERQDGYSFFNKSTEDVVKNFNKARLFSKYVR
jgi:hypothetical protein